MELEMGINWWEWEGMEMLQAIPAHLYAITPMTHGQFSVTWQHKKLRLLTT